MIFLYRNFLYFVKKKKKKGLKIPKGTLKAVNRWTGNTVAKRKKDKTTNNDLQNTTHKTKIEQHERHYKRCVYSGTQD